MEAEKQFQSAKLRGRYSNIRLKKVSSNKRIWLKKDFKETFAHRDSLNPD